MNETTQQYIKRILSYQQGKQPLKVLAATPKTIERLLKKTTRTRLMKPAAKGKWSIADILAHLAESDLVLAYRIRTILGKNGTTIQAFDQDVWFKNSHEASRDPKKSLQLLSIVRDSNVRLLKSIPKTKWKYYGMHEERGKETLLRVVEMYAGHDINHVLQIEKLVKNKWG